MPDPKQKTRSVTRAPKPKKTLGLSLPIPLRLPHEDLIKLEHSIAATHPSLESTTGVPEYRSTGVPEYRSNSTIENGTEVPQSLKSTPAIKEEQQQSLAITLEPKFEQNATEQRNPEIKINMPRGMEEKARSIGPQTNFYRKPNNAADQLDRTLSPAQSKIYDHLFRLSIGFNKDICQVRISTLQERTGYRSDKTIREAINGLIAKGLISKISTQNSPLGDYYQITNPNALPINNSIENEINNTNNEINLIENQINPIENQINYEINSGTQIDNFNSNNTGTPVLQYSSTAVKNTAVLESKITGHLNTVKTKEDDDCPLVATIRSIFPQIEDEKIFQTRQEILSLVAGAISSRVQKAKTPPVSPAYIVEIVHNLCLSPEKRNSGLRQKMEKIIAQVSSTYVGSQLPISELAARVKDICAKEEIGFDADLFNELTNRRS